MPWRATAHSFQEKVAACRLQHFSESSAQWRVLSRRRTLTKHGHGTAPGPFRDSKDSRQQSGSRNFRNSRHQSGSRNFRNSRHQSGSRNSRILFAIECSLPSPPSPTYPRMHGQGPETSCHITPSFLQILNSPQVHSFRTTAIPFQIGEIVATSPDP